MSESQKLSKLSKLSKIKALKSLGTPKTRNALDESMEAIDTSHLGGTAQELGEQGGHSIRPVGDAAKRPLGDQDVVASLQGLENLGLPDALSVTIQDQDLQTLESLDLTLLGEMEFPKVKSLVLKWTNLKMLEILKLKALGEMFPNLESLDLTGAQISDEGLKALVSSLSRLKSMDLSLCREEITDNGLKGSLSSSSLESLEILDLSESSAITDGFFEAVLSSLPGLKSLNLSTSTHDDFTLETVTLSPWFSLKSRNLETLDLSQSSNVTVVGLKAVLPVLSSLKDLDLSSIPGVTDQILWSVFPLLPGLRSLDLHDCENVTDRGLRKMFAEWDEKKLPIVGSLNVRDCKWITKEGIEESIRAVLNRRIRIRIEIEDTAQPRAALTRSEPVEVQTFEMLTVRFKDRIFFPGLVGCLALVHWNDEKDEGYVWHVDGLTLFMVLNPQPDMSLKHVNKAHDGVNHWKKECHDLGGTSYLAGPNADEQAMKFFNIAAKEHCLKTDAGPVTVAFDTITCEWEEISS
jgi:hypothetical protein